MQCLEYLGCIILLAPSQIFGPSPILSTDALLGRPPENFCAIFSEDQGPPLAKHNGGQMSKNDRSSTWNHEKVSKLSYLSGLFEIIPINIEVSGLTLKFKV